MKAEVSPSAKSTERCEQILGVCFFNGTVTEAVRALSGGLVVAPSGTCFGRFLEDVEYRRAIVTADLVLPDSGLMVNLWRLLQGRSLQRISGLAYLKQLLASSLSTPNAIWVLPNERAQAKLLQWSAANDRGLRKEFCYVAPIYPAGVQDEILLALIEAQRPRHVVIAIGAGAQEKLGFFLRENLSYRLAIHCIGGALGFITGDQVSIPEWADRLYLGWFLRLLSQPRVFIPRLWEARILPWLIWKYREHLPPLEPGGS